LKLPVLRLLSSEGIVLGLPDHFAFTIDMSVEDHVVDVTRQCAPQRGPTGWASWFRLERKPATARTRQQSFLDVLAFWGGEHPGMDLAHEPSIRRVKRAECHDRRIGIAVEKALIPEAGVVRMRLWEMQRVSAKSTV
jgi:hypothetical protein